MAIRKKRFGAWTIIGKGKPNKEGRPQVKCRCNGFGERKGACGNTIDIRFSDLVRGKSSKCRTCSSIYTAKLSARKQTTHGHMVGARDGRTTLTYSSWKSMIQRCTNPNSSAYKYYGAKGIKVWRGWQGKGGFVKFLADVGERPSREYTLDRYPDKAGGYKPGNIRWATKRQQANNMRNNVLLTVGQVTRTLPEWARRYGIDPSTLKNRIAAGWPVSRAIKLPAMSPTESGLYSAKIRAKKLRKSIS